MAIPKTVERKITTDFDDPNEITMTIDPKGMKFLMSLLERMYENPIGAVVREYTTNAIDAHIAVGNKSPIKVTRPSWAAPTFKVQDFGIGMSFEDISDTYSMYVRSTKRQDNSQAGMFGIGSKSALAIGDMFTVVSIQSGKRTECIIYKKSRGVSKIKTTVTDSNEPDGTTVSIPATDVSRFNREINEYFKYLRKGLVRVDGVDLGETFEGQKVDDDTFILGNNARDSVIVMGNVPYKVSTYSIAAQGFIVKYVPAGTFEPTPAREGLEDIEGRDQKIVSYFNDIGKRLGATFTKELKGLSDKAASAQIVSQMPILSKWGALKDVKFRGIGMMDAFYPKNAVILESSTKVSKSKIPFWKYFGSVHVVNVPGATVKELSETTLRKCWASKGYRDSGVIIHLGISTQYGVSSRDWSVVSKNREAPSYSYSKPANTAVKAGDDWKVPTSPPSYSTHSSGTYTYNKHNTKVVPFDKWEGDDDKRDLVYFTPTDVTDRSRANLLAALFEDKNVFLVIKYANQHDKTKRDTPEAIYFTEYGKTLAKALIKRHGQEPFLVDNFNKNWFAIKSDLIDKAKKLAEAMKKKQGLSASEIATVRSFGKDLLTDQQKIDRLVEDIKSRYPLLEYMSWSTKKKQQDFQDYVDAMDAAAEEKK